MKKLFAAIVLTGVISVSAFAGDINSAPGLIPDPPPSVIVQIILLIVG
jgi:hypothetical protein